MGRPARPPLAPRTPEGGPRKPSQVELNACGGRRLPAPRVLTAGVGARRRSAFLLLRELGRGEGGAVEDVALADFQLVDAEERQRLARDHSAGDDHGRAFGVERTQPAALGHRYGGEALELPRETVGGENVAVDTVAVVLVEPEVEGREAGDRAC